VFSFLYQFPVKANIYILVIILVLLAQYLLWYTRRYITMGNEFNDMYNKDDFNGNDEVNSDAAQSAQTTDNDSPIVSGSNGELYDFSKASKTTKGPERIEMDGKEVTVSKIELKIPSEDTPWELSKSKTTKYKKCIFSVFYDDEGQKEYYSGIKVFERKVNNVSKYSDPAIQNGGTTQVSQLKQTYAEFKGKKVEEVSLHEFFAFLNSKPRAVLKLKDFEFFDEKTNKKVITKKNIIDKFM